MQHDFRQQPEGEAADRFLSWLEQETISYLSRCHGDAKALKGGIFLFVNRAYEAHLPDEQIGTIFGRCFVRAEWPEADETFAFDTLEYFGEIAAAVHRDCSQ